VEYSKKDKKRKETNLKNHNAT